ncbi:MAG TPA: ABC transporter permease [Gemmatimonadaceae bacterium]|jgi:predicted permease
MMMLDTVRRATRRARTLFGRGIVEREMADEMAMHLDLEIEDRIRRGMDPVEARRTALVDFGGVERFKDEGRAARGGQIVDDLAQDGRYALRVLRNSPAFTLTSVFTVAIGVAATTAVLGGANALLFRAPPVVNPERLVVVSEVWKGGDKSWETSMGQYMYRYAHYLDLRDATTSVFDGLAGYRYGSVAMRFGDDARSVSSLAVTSDYFDVLGLHPSLGRFFAATARGTAVEPQVVLNHDFWMKEFGSDTSIVGKSIFVDGRAFAVVGVASEGFAGTMIGLVGDVFISTSDGSLAMIGRLAPSISRDRATAMLTAIGQNLSIDIPAQRIARMTLDPLTGPPAMARAPVIGFVGILMATAALVLLIVAANIAGMFLARAAHRRREIAIRLALGAARGRVVRQLLTESVVLCLAGGVVGVMLATWLTHLASAVDVPFAPHTSFDAHPDARVFVISFVAALTVAIIAGLTPALQSTRIDLLTTLRGLVGQNAVGTKRARSAFVVAQLAMALVLLLTAGLFARAVQRSIVLDRGIDGHDVVTAEITVGAHGYDRERGEAFYAELIERLRARPEIASVAIGEWTPLSVSSMGQGINTTDGRRVAVTWGVATNGFTETMRVPLVSGRTLAASDTRTSNPVVLVNETLARAMWPGLSPIGQQLKLEGMREVVGVIHDGKYRRLDEAPTSYALIPFSQRFAERATIYARARGESSAAMAAVRAEIGALDRNIALERAGVVDEQLELYTLPQRVAAWSVGVFGVFGLVLAALGIYGMIAYSAAQRMKELGIRSALGAQSRDLVRELLKPAVRAVVMSMLFGLPLAFAIARVSRRFLFGVGALDQATFAIVPVGLASIALVASYIPARRAARVDPIVSLRAD